MPPICSGDGCLEEGVLYNAPYNWLKSVLKFHKKKEDNTLKNQDNPILPPFRMETTGVTRYGGTGI